MGAVAISRDEKFYLLDRELALDIGEISLKNCKLDSAHAIAKKLVAMPKYKGVFSLRSMRRYVTEAIERKMEKLEFDRRIEEAPAGSPWRPVSAWFPIEPEMRQALREKALETFRYDAAQHEFYSNKLWWELSPKELHQRAMQRAKRPRS
jgi:hypothetical protein